MATHPPKRISSRVGLGLNTTKSMELISDSISIGTEIWNDLVEPWKQGETIIAKPGYIWRTKWEVGKPYVITKFYDDKSKLVAVYCDVSRPVQLNQNDFTFDDLYLDVWFVPNQDPVVLDEDELIEAVDAGYITSNEAKVAQQIAAELVDNITKHSKFLDY